MERSLGDHHQSAIRNPQSAIALLSRPLAVAARLIGVHAAHAFEVPAVSGVKFHSLLTVSLGGVGVIDHVVNDTGAAADDPGTVPVNIVSFP